MDDIGQQDGQNGEGGLGRPIEAYGDALIGEKEQNAIDQDAGCSRYNSRACSEGSSSRKKLGHRSLHRPWG